MYISIQLGFRSSASGIFYHQSHTVVTLQHIEKILKQKSLEIQLWETKLAQQAMQGAEDRQKDLTEKRNVSYLLFSSTPTSISFGFIIFRLHQKSTI